jgi:hypothetical protein
MVSQACTVFSLQRGELCMSSAGDARGSRLLRGLPEPEQYLSSGFFAGSGAAAH